MASESTQAKDNEPLLHDPSTASEGLAAEVIVDEMNDQLHNATYGSLHGSQNNDVVNHTMERQIYKIPKSQRNIILASIYTSIFLGALDSTIIATLLPIIANEFDSLPKMSWIVTSYLLSCASFQPLFGKISDIFGRNVIFTLCNLMFIIGCLFSGLTNSFYILVISRFITGIGGGGFNTLGTITMSDIIPLHERGIYQGYGNIAFGLGAASGGIVAGFFEKSLGGWRMAFLIQVPICLLSGCCIYKFLRLPVSNTHESKFEKLRKIDYIGSIILVSSLILFMMATTVINNNKISFSFITLMFIASLSGLYLFYFYELKYAKDPVIPVHLLRDRTVISSSLNCWFLSMSTFTNLFFAPFFWQSVKNYTATQSGFRIISNFVGVSIGSVFAGYYMKHTGRYYKLSFIVGVCTIVGYFGVYLLDINTASFYEMFVLFLPGFGLAVMITVSLVAMISSVDQKEQALTTSIQYGFRSVGSTVGVSLAGAIFSSVLKKSLVNNLSELDLPVKEFKEIVRNSLKDSEYAHKLTDKTIKSAILSAYNSGCHSSFLFALFCCILAVICNLFLKESRLHKQAE